MSVVKKEPCRLPGWQILGAEGVGFVGLGLAFPISSRSASRVLRSPWDVRRPKNCESILGPLSPKS